MLWVLRQPVAQQVCDGEQVTPQAPQFELVFKSVQAPPQQP
jgi:hypothetical protein